MALIVFSRQNLEKAGLLSSNSGTKTFGTLRKRLNLISDVVDEQVIPQEIPRLQSSMLF